MIYPTNTPSNTTVIGDEVKREVNGTLAGSVDANGILHFSAKMGAEYFYTTAAVDNLSHTSTQGTTLPHSQVILLPHPVNLEHTFYLTSNASSNILSIPLQHPSESTRNTTTNSYHRPVLGA